MTQLVEEFDQKFSEKDGQLKRVTDQLSKLVKAFDESRSL
jgi:hypothetical protein